MSEDNSILTNLKNKITYNVRQAVTDPTANEAAKKEKEREDLKKKKEEEEQKANIDKKKEEQVNKFSGTRLLKKVGTQTTNIFKLLLLPFVALMLSMIVANEMIVYSPPIRIIFFIFIFIISYFLPFYAIILTIYYIFKGGYSYYVNNMTSNPKRDIVPTIFALLPITTYKPESSFTAFLLYPFTYPKTPQAAEKLPEIMKQYWNDLIESYKGYDIVKNLPIFVDDIRKLQIDLKKMNEIKNNNVKNIVNKDNVVNKVNVDNVDNKVSVDNVDNKVSVDNVDNKDDFKINQSKTI